MTPRDPYRGTYSEDALIERPAVKLFASLGWQTINAYEEVFGVEGTLGRDTDQEVVLVRELRRALKRLNREASDESIADAVEQMTRDRSMMSAARANQDVWKLLAEGARVKAHDDERDDAIVTIQFIDWTDPEANDFLLVEQLWVFGEMYRRRCDLVGFVNGIPLVFLELKASHRRLQAAYDDNLTDYRDTIPQIFWWNGFIILSNGSATRVGSTTASWEHFAEWKRINDEGETGVVSLETTIRGTCDKSKLLDLVRNFTVFQEAKGGIIKKVAKNHQFLGVNRAIQSVGEIQANRGRLGVFWHTQGSGKSLSMIFFAQKILRTVPGNWTFVIVTDREELDGQIYKEFASVGAVTEKEAHAESGDHLRQLLRENHRYVFTLIQKFRTDKGTLFPKLSDRSDIIVITDEAHRSQYDTFAFNMRQALPNAAFLGFTGTPLMQQGEERTKEVFGDYVSIYNFAQSIEDHATVPLYYENRIPELQLTNDELSDDILAVIEEADLNDAEERKLERELGREYHLITREDRLERVAQDIVRHFLERGQRGKAMVVSIDKATAVRMYDKVRKHWQAYRDEVQRSLATAAPEDRPAIHEKLAYIDETDMAVVVSQAQNEVKEMRERGLDIAKHRKRMLSEDLATKFKNAEDPLRLVFVCAMWMTGFDVPSCSTIYLDKPMRNHTLMQTIARANRVVEGKVNGLIVDYVGIFRNLQKALAIYAQPSHSGSTDTPITDKSVLVEILRGALSETDAYCRERGVALQEIVAKTAFSRVAAIDDAVERLIASDEEKRQFLHRATGVLKLYKAILPDPIAAQIAAPCTLLGILVTKIGSLVDPPDISAVMKQIEAVLDVSIATEGYLIHDAPQERLIDLSQIDFDKLQAKFAQGKKRTEAERLRALIDRKVREMVLWNRQRIDYLARFETMIAEYNAGSMNVEEFFRQLVAFSQELSEEEKRHIAEQLSEEELALFDIVTKPDPVLSKSEEADVKRICKDLLAKLKAEKLVLDWRKRQQARSAVRLTIERTLEDLPKAYTDDLYNLKCELAYRHVYDCYAGESMSVYTLSPT
jgi:type I restriction enzyme R subunit